MSVAQNKQAVQSFFDAGNRGDMDTCFSLLSENIRWTNVGTTSFSGTFEGIENLSEKLLGPLFGRLKAGIHMDIQLLVAEGEYVVARMNGTAETHQGKSYNNTYCWIIRLEDEKFAEVTEFSDTELITSVFG
jgi:uncharacterized protein